MLVRFSDVDLGIGIHAHLPIITQQHRIESFHERLPHEVGAALNGVVIVEVLEVSAFDANPLRRHQIPSSLDIGVALFHR